MGHDGAAYPVGAGTVFRIIQILDVIPDRSQNAPGKNQRVVGEGIDDHIPPGLHDQIENGKGIVIEKGSQIGAALAGLFL